MERTLSSTPRAGSVRSCRGLACRTASVAHLLVVVFLLAGCGDRLVELPLDRRTAVLVTQAEGPLRCPADTVLLTDDDPGSGAGAVPTDFDTETALRCEVDYQTMRSSGGLDRFTVRQWQRPVTPQLRDSLDLPDRELRPARACASASASTTALYLVDRRRQAVRVLLPTDDPCSQIRPEVAALLPADDSPVDTTFQASRASR
jgi:hypothetical protein